MKEETKCSLYALGAIILIGVVLLGSEAVNHINLIQ
jgi:hypothetical protein|tara:strand:- start:210 stop:317 length:108 start_codon:yes stop_codon:yes gene_type:complete